PFVYLAEALLGWPLWIFFRRHGIRSVMLFIVGGASIGFSVVMLSLFVPGSRWDSFFVVLCTVSGGIAGAIFRVIALSSGQSVRTDPSSESGPGFPKNPFLAD